jgi:hypothetical protein
MQCVGFLLINFLSLLKSLSKVQYVFVTILFLVVWVLPSELPSLGRSEVRGKIVIFINNYLFKTVCILEIRRNKLYWNDLQPTFLVPLA